MYTVEQLLARRAESGVAQRPNRRPPIPFVVSILERYIRDGDVVVDIGCGTGPYRGVLPGKLIGIDQYQGAREDHWGDADLVGDVGALPLEDGSVDVAFSVATIYQVPAPGRALAELRRILKPAGRMVLFDYNARTQRRLAKLYGRSLPCWSQWQLRTLIRQAGFEEVDMLVPTHHVPGTLEFWVRYFHQIWQSEWAIVTAVNPGGAPK